MAPATLSHDFGETISLRRRAISFVLAAIANALLLFVLFTLAPAAGPRRTSEAGPTTVTLLPDTPAPERSRKPDRQPPAVPRTQPQRPAKAALPPPVVTLPTPPLNMIVMSRDDFAAADIARLPAAAAAPAETGGGQPGDTKLASGRAPNGEQLYNAEWYREPTDAELGGYLPAGAPRTGWALIACRTVANYRVEDCAELGQSPPGSGLARAIRQAAWQFRVRPPRVGGKAMVGSWVSIRIDFTAHAPG